MIKILVSLVVIAIATSATAQPLDLDAIARQPGTEVIKGRAKDGTKIVTIKRAGVEVIIQGDEEISIDRSGPAVLCIWALAFETQIAADLCYPNEYPQLSKMLSDYVDAANNFIVANSLRPVSKAELEKAIAERRAKVAAGIEKFGVPSARKSFCQGQGQLLIAWNKEPEKFRQELWQGLTVPRPPAKNPCL
jgi:hypothetical protein